jgi:drug/metabolite transporter (DMT)-like permease
MSISFFFVFKQTLKKIEILGIILSIGGVLIIAFSKSMPAYTTDANFVHPIWSILALIMALLFIVIRYTLFKFEVERVPGANTSTLRSFVVLMTGVPVLMAAIIYWSI